MMQSKPYYLASPYSKYPGGYEAAFDVVSTIAARLYEKGIVVFGPISHSHPISIRLETARPTYEHWLALDLWAVTASCGVIVAEMEGWRESIGVTAELEHAKKLGLPILYLDPKTMFISFEPHDA